MARRPDVKPDRPGSTMALCLLGSLAVHAFGLAVAARMSEVADVRVTRAENVEAITEPDEPEAEPLRPGLDDGTAAKVTWIGFDEYQEHLARLSETEQAAMTAAAARGAPAAEWSTPVEPTQPEPGRIEISETAAAPPVEVSAPDVDAPTVVAPEAVQPADSAAASRIGEGVRDALTRLAEALDAAAEAVPSDSGATSIVVESPTAAPDELFRPEAAERAPEVEATPTLKHPTPPPLQAVPVEEPSSAAPASAPEPVETGGVEVDASSKPESSRPEAVEPAMPGSNAPEAAPVGEPVEKDAVPAELDSEATSTTPIPEVEWKSGKPLAMQGLEIRPYSLYRHIVVDSGDTLLTFTWNGRVERNPVVSLRFDRRGRVAELRILRKSGFKTLDEVYLGTWLARWTAHGKPLEQLLEGQLTEAIVFKIVFIEEPEAEPARQS